MKRHVHRRAAAPLTPRASKRRQIKPRTPFRNIIASRIEDKMCAGVAVRREYALHATKGFRALRAL